MNSQEAVESTANVVVPLDRQKSLPSDVAAWLRNHPLLTALGLLFVIVIVEILSIPGAVSITELKTNNPGTTALMEARLRERGNLWRVHQHWVPLQNISPHLVHAVVVAEDGMFYDHEGFDWFEMQESIEKNLREWRFARGASTISQQLVKNLYLSASRDPIRKLKEMILTTRLEAVLSKDRILELYLNLIEWGDGIFGAEAAAQTYFGKPAADLTREEAARLAAVIPNPLKHTPNDDSQYVVSRSELGLSRMEARGW